MKKIFLLLKLNLIFFIAVIFIPIAQRFELLSSAPDSTQVRNRSVTSVPCHNTGSLVNSTNQLLVMLYTQSTDQFLWLVINIIHQWINLLINTVPKSHSVHHKNHPLLNKELIHVHVTCCYHCKVLLHVYM